MSAVRARFPEAAACRLQITPDDGQPLLVPIEAISLRTFNFRQHWRTEGVPEVSYRVEIPLAFALEELERQLPEFVDDSIRFPDDDPLPLETALRDADWPPPATVLSDPTLAPLALDWYAYDLLAAWFGCGEPSAQPGFVLNTIDGLGITDDGRAWFDGRGRRAGIPVRYQDA